MGKRLKHLWASVQVVLVAAVAGVVITPAPALADPSCTSAYVLFASGSQDVREFNGREASMFFTYVRFQLASMGISSDHAELGNLDGDGVLEWGEYPAVWGLQWVANPGYDESANIGANELVTHLNDRASRCPGEILVLGGYSQGGDAIGRALLREGTNSLYPSVKSRIGFVAFYGDPYYNGGGVFCRSYGSEPPWVRGDAPPCPALNIIFPQRSPYVPSELRYRTGSWCANGDGLCMHSTGPGNHGNAVYANVWIPESAGEIALAVYAKMFGVNMGTPGSSSGGSSSPAISLQMFLRGDSAVFAKDTLNHGDWTQETDPASIKAIAAAGKYQMVLNACNAVYAKDTLGMGGWVQETPCGGANKIAIGNTGVQMLIDACGAVWAKIGIGMGGWTREVDCGNADAIAVGGNTQMFIRGDKAVFAKTSVGEGGWQMQVGPANAIAIAADNTGMQAFIRWDGAVFAKRNHLGDGGWQMQAGPGNADAIAAGGGVLMFLRGDKAVFAKTNIGIDGGWQQQADPGTVTAIAMGNYGRMMVRSNTNAIYAKDNLVNGDWKLQVGDGNAEAIAVG